MRQNMIVAIMGDFTDWVRVNMQMYSQDEIAIDSTKKDVFYITM